MKFLDAALLVLASEGKPMAAGEVTDRAISAGLITTAGRTPEATLSAALYVEAKRPGPRVRKVAAPGRIRAKRGSVRWALTAASKRARPVQA